MSPFRDGIENLIKDLTHSRLFEDQIVYHRIEPEQKQVLEEIGDSLSVHSKRLLKVHNIEKLYSHQKKALNYIFQGKDVVIATPTASGKSLIYYLATLEGFFKSQKSTALYLYPLKALARDQVKEFEELVFPLSPALRPRAAVYDGDTSLREREEIKARPPNVLLTNPDMLHLGILPHHHGWHLFFSNLRYIVVDEVHTYRGVMGSHMAWVFRRLIRICHFYGSYPVFILCSATIGNPREHVELLISRKVVNISKSGAGMGKRHFLFINPLLHGAARAGFIILQSALYRNIRTILYTNSRKITELIGRWAKKSLSRFKEKVAVYRAGFLPEERRKIEEGLNTGKLQAVISTSALELGINIGGLELCILVGYPGSIMATYQRAGRVGRGKGESAVILLAGDDNLDQYFMKYPRDFFSLSPEKVSINPFNQKIMEKHLLCASLELPLHRGEEVVQDRRVWPKIVELVEGGELFYLEDEFLSRDKGIHARVNLRGMGRPLIIMEDSGEIIGEIDFVRAHRETYPGAVYLHNTRSYVIKEMDVEQARVICSRKEVRYFTRLFTQKETTILEKYYEKERRNIKIAYGRLEITENFVGYEKRRIKDQTLLGFYPLELDPLVFETEGLWISFPRSIEKEARHRFLHFMGGLHGLEHLLIGVMPHIVLADRNDIGGISTPLHPQLSMPGVFVYDAVAGGIGITREVFTRMDEVVNLAWRVITECECESGCFRCIHSPKCGAGNRPLDKEGTILLLAHLTGHPISAKKEYNRRGKRADSLCFGVLDIETQFSAREVGGWQNAAGMRVSCAVLYVSEGNRFLVFTEEKVPELIENLKALPLIIGFNILGFDYRVLAPYSPLKLSSLPTFDMLRDIHARLGYRVSLDNIARSTLSVSKSADGMQALRWWKEGKMDKIVEYCKKDVEITRDVFLFGRDNGFIFFTNKQGQRVRLEVQWDM